MSLTRETVLIDSLKQVSHQRLRSLKMDMQKLSRDSRIANERNFWSLLEFHSIKLDERTKREFRDEVLDNRGINIETAFRHLKRAQRKTGRDSVEVLIKENQPRAMSARHRNTPRSTPVLTEEPIKRNYKLDKLRSKAIGIGKLRAAFKSTTPASTLPAIANNPNVPQQPCESSKTLKQAEKTKVDNNPIKTKEKVKDDPPTKESESSTSLFKLLLQEDLKNEPKEKQTTTDNSLNPKTPISNKQEQKIEVIDKKQSKLIEKETTTNSANQPNTKQPKMKSKVSKESMLKLKINSKDDLLKDEKSSFPVNSQIVDVTTHKDDENNFITNDVTEEANLENNSSRKLDTNKNIVPKKTEDDLPIVAKPVLEESSKLILENKVTPANKNDALGVENSKDVEEKNGNSQIIAHTDVGNQANEDQSDKSNNNTDSVVIEMEIKPEVFIKQPEIKVVEETSSFPPNLKTEENADETSSAEDNVEKSKVVVDITVVTKTENHEPSSKMNEKKINEVKKVNEEKKAKKKKGKSTNRKVAEKSSKKVEEYITPKEENKNEEKDNNQNEKVVENNLDKEQEILDEKIFSESHSISTLSSVDDEQFSLDDIIRDMSSSVSGALEEIQVGENTLLMQVPEWIKEHEHKFNNPGPLRNKIEVDWVYGCNTAYPQCLTSIPCGDLVYYVGCIVIVYNPERKAQRHYLGHSATVNSVSAHPILNHVASAQLSFPIKKSTQPRSHDSGKIHVRIWDAVTMETMHVVGVGTIRDPIFKMQFLLMEGYFVTIENNADNTMTVWDGGCRVTSTTLTPSSSDQNTAEAPKTQIGWNHKKFVPTLPRSPYRPPVTKINKPKAPALKVNTAGARGLTFNFNNDGGFAIVGKHHVTFWQIEVDYEEEGRVKLAEAVNGDFGKFFRAEYLSCCLATNKFLDGSIITGDSNGTLLIWSEKTRTATRGFSHAHECHLSATCVSSEGLIFTSGVNDKTVKAFVCKHSKIEICGVLPIPQEVGSATSLVAIGNTLFVATEKHAIISVQFEFPAKTPESMTSPLRSSGSRSVTSSDDGSLTALSVFGKWNEYEVARGFGKGVRSCCSILPLKEKIRNRKVQSKEVKMPGVEEGLEIMRNQFSKQTGVRKYLRENPRLNRNNNIDDVRRPSTSASSPRLRANERILQRSRNDNNAKLTPLFSTNNAVQKNDVFCTDVVRATALGDYFVTSSNDGWIFICSSKEHIILARYQLPQPSDVTCVDACSKRHLVCVGTSTGLVIIVRINDKEFEILPQLQCKCSGGGLPYVNTVRFSPSGKKVAISIGYDVILASVRRLAFTELGRCIGHHSNVIIGLDWSSKKYSSTYFLRSCAITPTPEIKTWHSDTMLEVRSHDLLNRVTWATTSSILDYCIKGIWGNYLNYGDVTSSCVYSQSAKIGENNDVNSDDVEGTIAQSSDVNKTLVVGDVTGSITSQTFPCLRWIDNDNTKRAHFTPINNMALLSGRRHLLTTAKQEGALVQWALN